MMDLVWRHGRLWWGRFEVGSVYEANKHSFWPTVAGALVKGNLGCARRETAERIVEEQARSYLVALISAPGLGDVRKEEPTPSAGWIRL